MRRRRRKRLSERGKNETGKDLKMGKERKRKPKVVKIGFGRIRVNGVSKKWEEIEKKKRKRIRKKKRRL